MDTKALDAKYLGRDVPPTPVEIVKSKGCVLYDTTGKDYIDFLMGWNVGNLGWGIKEIEKDIRTYDGPDYVNPYYLFRPWGELAQILARITPGKLTKSFRATGGTEAVEIALQAAMGYTKRTKFISVEGAYHGHSIGAMSIGLSGFRQRYANLLPNCYTVKPPLDERAAREAEALIQKGDIAAYIAEPIILNLGVIIPDDRYYEIIQAACKKHGTLLIIDEVATGFGRTGKMFASEHYDIEPDIMCLGKALTGGYGAMGATVMTEEVAQSMAYDFSFYSTFGWHPRNAVAALSYLRYFLARKEEIVQNTERMGEYFEKRLRAMVFKHTAQIRRKGLAIGIEFKHKGYADEVVRKGVQYGVQLSTLGPFTITLFPALTIDEKTANEGLDRLHRCI